PDDQDSSNVITKTPVARMAISKSFSFSISARSADEIYTRYAVAVVTKEGERRLLCRPIYPDIHTGEVQNNTGFKGFHTGSIYTVLDSGADVEIVDVYLDRLLLRSSDSGDNILYAGDRSYYFFSEAEITALDHRIRNLTGNGCEVYLRFLVSPEATGLSYVNQVDSQIGVVNMGVDIKSEAALLEVHALTDFLTSRYYGGDKGTVTGIILGRAADRSSTYANIGAQGLAAYTEKYATYLNLVAGSARSNIPGLRIVVPISDRAHTDTVTFDDLSGEYFADLFLESLLLTMESLMLTPPAFTAMLEAREGAAVKDPDDTDSLYAFIDSVKARAAAHRFLDDKILYAWDPSTQYSSDALQAAYAIRYTALFFNDSVRSFIVDLSLNPSAQSIAQRLKHLLSKIDTAQGSALLEELKLTYGNAFSQYNAAALVVKQVDKLNVSLSGYQNGHIPTGSYTLFDFSQSGNRNEWYAGSSCNGVSVIDRALTAQMIADGADDYAGIAYAFGSPKNYSVAPLMRFEVGIPKTVANAGTLYEVQIRLIGVGRTVQASAVITPGSTQMLYLDLGGYTKSLEQLNSIRILARPLDGNTAPYELCLHTVTLESTTLNSTELAEQIAIHISDAGSGEEIINDQDHTVPILITGAVVFFSLTLITVIAIRHRRSKRRNKQ
ncbi:MAG: hypothetical protein IKM08_04580, partial [Clostridia bacterium]|nr:hypothetical protein [Clostridia bacterium]